MLQVTVQQKITVWCDGECTIQQVGKIPTGAPSEKVNLSVFPELIHLIVRKERSTMLRKAIKLKSHMTHQTKSCSLSTIISMKLLPYLPQIRSKMSENALSYIRRRLRGVIAVDSHQMHSTPSSIKYIRYWADWQPGAKESSIYRPAQQSRSAVELLIQLYQ